MIESSNTLKQTYSSPSLVRNQTTDIPIKDSAKAPRRTLSHSALRVSDAMNDTRTIHRRSARPLSAVINMRPSMTPSDADATRGADVPADTVSARASTSRPRSAPIVSMTPAIELLLDARQGFMTYLRQLEQMEHTEQAWIAPLTNMKNASVDDRIQFYQSKIRKIDEELEELAKAQGASVETFIELHHVMNAAKRELSEKIDLAAAIDDKLETRIGPGSNQNGEPKARRNTSDASAEVKSVESSARPKGLKRLLPSWMR